MIPDPTRGTLPDALLAEMASLVPADVAAEMAIPSYRHHNPLLRTMAWWRVRALAARLDVAARGRRGLRVLDYGCGAGVLLERASRLAAQVWGVDIELRPARLLCERLRLDNVTLLDPDEARAALPEQGVDLILAGEVLEHVEPLGEALDFLRSRLAPGGRMLVTLPTENAVYRVGRKIAGFSGHYHHADAARIDREIRAHGFEAERSRRLPLPGPLAIYWLVDYAPRSSFGAPGPQAALRPEPPA